MESTGKKMVWTEATKTNRPSNETPRYCWGQVETARVCLRNCGQDKNKIIYWLLELREHQEHMGVEITPISEYGITKQDLHEYFISDPVKTAKMLHDWLTTRQNELIKIEANKIKARFQKKIEQYREIAKGKKK